MRARDILKALRRVLVPGAALLLSGCATLSDAKRQDDFWSVWSRPPAAVSVFFATDRNLAEMATDPDWDLHRGDGLSCGQKQVAIPALFDTRTIKVEPASCDTAGALADFAAKVAQASHDNKCNSVLLIVHGFNTTFRSALLRSGQVALDMQWPCATLLFSWSSEGQFDRYVADDERSGYAVPALIALLRALGKAGVTIDVLAHSMGTRITLTALDGLCRDGVSASQLILAAPDVGAEAHNDDFGHLLERLAKCGQRTTIYASENDEALMISESVHGGIPRAGRVPRQDTQYVGRPQTYGKVDLVDATLAPGDPSAGHGYFALSYEMVTDLMWVLAGAPIERRAQADNPGGPTLTCPQWNGAVCADRYALLVRPDRRQQAPSWLVKAIWSLIYRIR